MQSPFTAVSLTLCLTSTVLLPAPARPQGSDLPQAVFIRIEEGRVPVVAPLERIPASGTLSGTGLLIWSEAGREQWRQVPEAQQTSGGPNTLALAPRFTAISRGESPAPAGDGTGMATVEIDQILGQLVVRGAGLLTPANNGRCLQPQITIRRQPADKKPRYPADSLVLLQGNRELARIPMADGQEKLAWTEIPGLPESLQDGLPPGEYTLRLEKSGESTTFTVEDSEIREWVLQSPAELAALLKTKDDPLCLLFTVEHLLSQLDEYGRPQPYLADALDLLEPGGRHERLRNDILRRLSGQPVEKRPADSDGDTGIAPIDEARRLIAEARWDAASERLDAAELGDSPRAAALATLYRAVILAESGQGTDAEARDLFRRAIDELAKGRAADAYRAGVNYANFLSGRTRDRLYNHALEIASGVEDPLIRALMNWQESLSYYEWSLKLAEKLGPAERTAVEVNMARLYCVLADILRTLAPSPRGQENLAAGEQSAARRARQLATAVTDKPAGQVDATILAVAWESLAQLDFRAGDQASCRRHAEAAMQHYLAAGSLAGAEGLHRLLGLLQLQESASADARNGALDHFLIAQLLAETLRDRIPTDRVGLSRAGFFARRAYVNERIVELLLADGRATEALGYAELAKARALEDVLAVGAPGAASEPSARRELSKILAQWPEDVAAVEYFLGSRAAWGFVIDTTGTVSSYPLVDEEGEPIASRDLVARVVRFLSETGHQADKMRPRLMAGRGFDHAWQDTLHAFCRQLLPSPALEAIRKAKTVLVVPHHVLHYFPFVALVTEPDTRQLTSERMAMPRYLLDEPFALCYAPSLTTWDLLREQPERPIRQVQAAGIVEFLDAPSLPGARKDIENLQAVFGSRVRKLLPGRDAFETGARELFGQEGLLFVATHGQNHADKPLASYLLFHPDQENDGYMTARELYASQVRADLVVMSACYSGLADRSPLPGDDLFGLERALLHSGARTVVAGVWDVYDGTGPELMHDFFVELVGGKPAPQAMAQSQRTFLNRLRQSEQVEPWLHPYFWAVYSVTGDDRTRMSAK